MLKAHYYIDKVEAGCDEAGRGSLAGSVFAAAVILPPDYDNPHLNDSKKLSPRQRYALREEIERDAVAWAVGEVTPDEIDKVNILHASFLAMHRALDRLAVRPEALIIDGPALYYYCKRRRPVPVHRGGQYPGQDLPRRLYGPPCRTIPHVRLAKQQGLSHAQAS